MARSPRRGTHAPTPDAPVPQPTHRFQVVGLGASAGGLEALKAFLSAVPAGTGMAFIVIQHLDPEQKSHMAELLAKHTALRVVEAEQGRPVEPGYAYTIPPGTVLTLREGRLHLEKAAPGRAVRMPIDLLFRSLAEGLGEAAVGIVLSGTGSDGTLGVRAIRGAGGLVLVQDPVSAEFDGMPQSAIATGLVDYVLPPAEMAAALLSYVRQARAQVEEPGASLEESAEQAFRDLLALLLRQTKSDFSGYKRGTLLRRIERRMSVAHVPTLAAYLRLLQEDGEEVNRLSKDLLIGVTSFFRDREAFDEVRTQVIAPLARGKEEGAPVRVWVPGCATGEEAYSVAMLLFAELAAAGRDAPVQVFASDVDEEALALARSGVYPAGIAADIPADLLERFFVKVESGYRITQQLREAVVFTTQDLLTAPPFSNLDLISCRNVLIYFSAEAQGKVLSLFAFALHEAGYLFLGKSDSILGYAEFFRAIATGGRLYQRTSIPHRAPGRFEVRPELAPTPAVREPRPPGQPQALLALPPQVLLDHFGATLVLVDARGDIVSFYGPSDRYLVHPTGRADLNLFSMARPRLSGRLRVGVRHALAQHTTVRLDRIPVLAEGESAPVDVTITPYLPAGAAEPVVAVIFQEAPPAEAASTARAGGEVEVGAAALAEQLESELRASQAELLAATAEFGASNEQLRAIHEEAVSVNEELQSTNEELEASKEELQSLNEELTTVNAQLGEKMEELTAANNDLLNLFSATEIATLFLDRELRIRRFTPAAEGLLNLIASDVGRPIGHLSPNFSGADLGRSAEAVLRQLSVVEQEVVGRDGRWYTMRAFPYRTVDDRIDGVVVTLADVTRLKHIEEALEEARAEADRRAAQAEEGSRLLEAIQESVPPLTAHLDRELTFTRVSTRFAETAGLHREDLEGRPYPEVFPKHLEIAALLRQALESGESVSMRESLLTPSRRPELGERYWDMVFTPVRGGEGLTAGVVMSVLDVTDRVRQRQRVEEAERARAEEAQLLATTLAHLSSGVAYLDPDFTFLQCNDQYTVAAGYPREELIGRTIAEVFPDEELLAKFARVRETGEAGTFTEMPFVFPDQPERGTTYWDWALVPVQGENGASMGYVLSALEATERVSQRERLLRAERARTELAETLNREIAHRVKNNLAMMAGLLQLQIAEHPDAEISAVLRNTVGRLLAFADIHAQMQAVGEGDLDLLAALRQIAGASREAFAQKRVIVSIEGEPAPLPSRAATNLAVVANELITNAIKHGAAEPDGEMRVDIGVYRAERKLRLSVWNSGNPVPGDFDSAGNPHMGLRLIWGLTVEQYGGVFSLRPHAGGTMAEVVVEEGKLTS